jgi:hypothetical protein
MEELEIYERTGSLKVPLANPPTLVMLVRPLPMLPRWRCGRERIKENEKMRNATLLLRHKIGAEGRLRFKQGLTVGLLRPGGPAVIARPEMRSRRGSGGRGDVAKGVDVPRVVGVGETRDAENGKKGEE